MSISIDLDPLICYARIYGLANAAVPTRPDPVLTRAVERILAWLGELNARATLFTVGQSLQAEEPMTVLRAAVDAGMELANHTWSHPYDLSRLPDDALESEIERGAAALVPLLGRRPAGFRAPGYMLGKRVLPVVEQAGARYDASLLPSPVYQAAKLSVMGLLRLRGKPSAAIAGDPRETLSKTRPFRPDPHKPWREGASALVELPVSAAFGLPLTGHVLALGGTSLASRLAAWLRRRPFVQLELHGVDFLDVTADGLNPALRAQRDLCIPWEKKVAAHSAFVKKMMETHCVVTLEEAAYSAIAES